MPMKMPVGNNPVNSAGGLVRNTLNRAQAQKSQDVEVTADMAKALGIPSNKPTKRTAAAVDPFPSMDKSTSKPKWSK